MKKFTVIPTVLAFHCFHKIRAKTAQERFMLAFGFILCSAGFAAFRSMGGRNIMGEGHIEGRIGELPSWPPGSREGWARDKTDPFRLHLR